MGSGVGDELAKAEATCWMVKSGPDAPLSAMVVVGVAESPEVIYRVYVSVSPNPSKERFPKLVTAALVVLTRPASASLMAFDTFAAKLVSVSVKAADKMGTGGSPSGVIMISPPVVGCIAPEVRDWP